MDLMVDPKGMTHAELSDDGCQTCCDCKNFHTKEAIGFSALLSLYRWKNGRMQRLVWTWWLSRMLLQVHELWDNHAQHKCEGHQYGTLNLC